MIYKFIREVQKEQKIKALDLANAIGVSQKHLYSYLNGKAGMSGEKEWALIMAIEEIAPGSRLKIAMAIAGDLTQDQQANLLNLIAKNMRKDRSKEQTPSKIAERDKDLLAVS